MEDNTNIFEPLFESAVDYSKTGYELVKLKALDKTSDVVSSLISHYAVLILVASFILFLTIGLAYWVGEIFGKIYFGFFAVAVLYGILGGALGLISGYLTKKLAVGGSGNIIKKLLGTILQFGVTSVVAQHPRTIAAVGQFLLQKILRKKEQNTQIS